MKTRPVAIYLLSLFGWLSFWCPCPMLLLVFSVHLSLSLCVLAALPPCTISIELASCPSLSFLLCPRLSSCPCCFSFVVFVYELWQAASAPRIAAFPLQSHSGSQRESVAHLAAESSGSIRLASARVFQCSLSLSLWH